MNSDSLLIDVARWSLERMQLCGFLPCTFLIPLEICLMMVFLTDTTIYSNHATALIPYLTLLREYREKNKTHQSD